jgi:protein tyrosine phosphatase (PTP) superfamily phosphohydrolase (DUF442 family)
MQLNEIRAFLIVDHLVATAGQPAEDQLELIAQNGYEVIINLGLMDKRYCLEDEASTVASLGMKYVHIPVDFAKPLQTDFDKFVNTMTEFKDKKILVHCAANYRASCFLGAYYFTIGVWNHRQAIDFIERVWKPDPTWQDFLNKQTASTSVAV